MRDLSHLLKTKNHTGNTGNTGKSQKPEQERETFRYVDKREIPESHEGEKSAILPLCVQKSLEEISSGVSTRETRKDQAGEMSNPAPIVQPCSPNADISENPANLEPADGARSSSGDELPEHQVSLALRALQNHGTRPAFFIHPVTCRRCGPVWERDWTDDQVESCAWCYRKFKGEIPRPTAGDFRAWKASHEPAHGKTPSSDQEEHRTERAAIREYSGGQSRDQAEQGASEEIGPCYSCGGGRFWVSRWGVIVCERCHPPATPKMIERTITLSIDRAKVA